MLHLLFDIISDVDKLLIDGVLVEIKIMEKWGFNLGEDACLFEDDNDSKVSLNDQIECHGDPEINNNADVLVEKLVEELVEEERLSMKHVAAKFYRYMVVEA